jgi:hypothetical protein
MEKENSQNIFDNNANNLLARDLVLKEVEMGYFENFSSDENNSKSSFNGGDGCSRISYCNCNCNDCIALAG